MRSRGLALATVAATVIAAASVGAALAPSSPRPTPSPTASPTIVRIVAFSDYHSHAVPFFSEGRPGQAGIARAVAFLKEQRRRPNTIVVSGGDMVNRGSPLWSDVYGCIEWRWLAGLVDVWALGNHELDYGPEAFAACRAASQAPVLSGNLVDASGAPVLTAGGKPFLIKTVGGVRIGLFAVGGPDMARLVKPENMPAGTHWVDPVPVARRIVEQLRAQTDAVVFIGHQAREDDEAMVAAVEGINVVLGTHSHYKGEGAILARRALFLSPYQYLTYVTVVDLEFRDGKLTGSKGWLAPMDSDQAEDPAVAAEVARLQRELVAAHPDRFRVVGRTVRGLSDEGVSSGESVIGNWATEVLRRAAGTQAYLATASSFRGGLPAGEVTLEDFYAAIPYTNRVVVAELTGRQVADLVAASVSRAGSDGFSQQSGLRYRLADGRPTDIQVLRDAARPEDGYAPLLPESRYRVGTSDYQAKIASGYKDLFAAAGAGTPTEIDAQRALLDDLARAPAEATRDGRSGATR